MVRSARDDERDRKLLALIDKDEIRDLILRYCRAVDRCDLDLMLSCYHPDARDHHGFFVGNAHEFCRYVIPVLERAESTTHSISNALIELDGDRAFGESYVRVTHRVAVSGEALVDNNSRGRYLDVFERRNGAWRILHRHYVNDSMSNDAALPPAAEGFAELVHAVAFAPACHGRADPSYLRYDITGLAEKDFRMEEFWKAALADSESA